MRRGDASRSPPSARWRSKGLNSHFVTALYLQGQPLCLGGAAGTVCSCFSNAQTPHCARTTRLRLIGCPELEFTAPDVVHLVLPQPHIPWAGVATRDQGEQNFFFSLSVTSSHLTFLRNEGCRQILKVFWRLKTRLGNQAFQRQPDCIFRH